MHSSLLLRGCHSLPIVSSLRLDTFITHGTLLMLFHYLVDLFVDDIAAEGLPNWMYLHGIREGPCPIWLYAVEDVEFAQYHSNYFERKLIKLSHCVCSGYY